MKMANSATMVERTAMAMVAGWDKVEPDEPEVLVSVLSVRPLPPLGPPFPGSEPGTPELVGFAGAVVSGMFGTSVGAAPSAVFVYCLSYGTCQRGTGIRMHV